MQSAVIPTILDKYHYTKALHESDADLDVFRSALRRNPGFLYDADFARLFDTFCSPTSCLSMHLDAGKILDHVSAKWTSRWPYNKENHPYRYDSAEYLIDAEKRNGDVHVIGARRRDCPVTEKGSPHLASIGITSFDGVERTATCQFLKLCERSKNVNLLRQCFEDFRLPLPEHLRD
eukprot:TRINITY_DN46511_c0_g1_i1.p1 TRINITY_DN46511_c0_g1~~TRINITY_DN46511_c0_g1_i1.p1  ORF type:complete len:177 (+),score=24.00 TRINITY_DN46511_c0_g1_i1:228-758(+)